MDNRGVSPVIEKTLAIGLVALFVAGTTGTLLGGAVPDYRSSVGGEVGDRVLATAASEIEQVVPATSGNVTVRSAVELPGTIRGQSYELELDDGALQLRHPNPAIGGSTNLAVPASVSIQEGRWSGGTFVVSVRGSASDRSLSVEEGSA